MGSTLRVVLLTIAALIVFFTGVLLTRAGRPYGSALLTVHKLVHVAAVVFIVVQAVGVARGRACRQEACRRINELCESLGSLRGPKFDLVLLYPTLWHYALAFGRLGIPYVQADPNLSLTWNLEIPPVFSGLHPVVDRPLLNRLRCAGAWFAFRYFGAFSHRYRGIIQPRPSGLPDRVHDACVVARHFLRNVLEPLSVPV